MRRLTVLDLSARAIWLLLLRVAAGIGLMSALLGVGDGAGVVLAGSIVETFEPHASGDVAELPS
jgi:hypothetical protein